MNNVKRIMHILTVIAVVTLLVLMFVLPAHAEEPEEDVSSGSFAPYSGSETYGAEMDTDYLLEAFAQSCNYTTRGDNPHVSRTGNEVSVHGWWTIDSDSGPCPTYADVEVWLQGWYCIEGVTCWWRTIDEDEKRVRAGGGAGNRTNARAFCVSDKVTGFRNVVDVDLVGVSDPPDKLYIIADVPCRPANP